MGAAPILSPEQLDEMRALRARNRTYKQIAAHFTDAGTPISYKAIERQCLKLGAEPPARFVPKQPVSFRPYFRNGVLVRPYSPEEDERLIEADCAGPGAVSRVAREIGRPTPSAYVRIHTLTRRMVREEAGTLA